MGDLLLFTEKNIEKVHREVLKSISYGNEEKIIHDVLNSFPENDDINVIAMKIAVIDVTNSTQLSRYKNKISLYELANIILNIDNFDERVKNGDPELVNIISKSNGKINLFSFASKYCTYHNNEIYEKDDYSIFDSVVRRMLPKYSNISFSQIEKWRKIHDYKSFNDSITKLLDDNNIHIKFRKRKFDHFLWFPNK